MVEVTFHHGPKVLEAVEHYCCTLVRSGYLAGQKLLLKTRNEEQMKRLDQMLWELPNSFVPHGPQDDPHKPPVVLTCTDTAPTGDSFEVLVIAPGADMPDDLEQFRKAHYLVLANAGDEHRTAREAFSKLMHKGVKPGNQTIPTD